VGKQAFTAALVAVCGVLGSAPAQTNLLSNGSFESTDPADYQFGTFNDRFGYLTDAYQILFFFSEMKTNTKAKAKRVMKASYTQLSLDL